METLYFGFWNIIIYKGMGYEIIVIDLADI